MILLLIIMLVILIIVIIMIGRLLPGALAGAHAAGAGDRRLPDGVGTNKFSQRGFHKRGFQTGSGQTCTLPYLLSHLFSARTCLLPHVAILAIHVAICCPSGSRLLSISLLWLLLLLLLFIICHRLLWASLRWARSRSPPSAFGSAWRSLGT